VIETIMHELIHGSLRKETAVFTIMGFVPYPCHSISLFPQSFDTSFSVLYDFNTLSPFSSTLQFDPHMHRSVYESYRTKTQSGMSTPL
jgi:hypothetical protein